MMRKRRTMKRKEEGHVEEVLHCRAAWLWGCRQETAQEPRPRQWEG